MGLADVGLGEEGWRSVGGSRVGRGVLFSGGGVEV